MAANFHPMIIYIVPRPAIKGTMIYVPQVQYESGAEKPLAYSLKHCQVVKRTLRSTRIIFWVKIHQHLYGHMLTFLPDHKPFLTIFNPICSQ